MSEERTYFIGTHDAEIERLGVQHRVWRASVLAFWRAGGLTEGMTVIDAGAGPGHATLDLAEIVGPKGRVIALERSRRFLDELKQRAHARGLDNIDAIETDLADINWRSLAADRLWCRWVLAFVDNPASIVRGMAQALKPGGAALIHEYYDYASWKMLPHSPIFESYVAKIIARWRASGGEPDIALALPSLLAQAGLDTASVQPIVYAAAMQNYAARWPIGFAREYLPTMIANGDVSEEEGRHIASLLAGYEANPRAYVITPGVLHIMASKPF